MQIKPDTIQTNINKGIFLLTGICLLPFVLLCIYVHPHYDDYDFVNKLAGLNAFEGTAYWYNTWSGRYSSIFLSNLLTYGTTNLTIYRLFPLLLMSLYLASFYSLFKTLFGFMYSKTKLMLLSLFFLTLYIYKMPEVTTGFYYFICSYVSSTGTIALIFLMSVLLKLLNPEVKNKTRLILFGIFLVLYIGGSYETTMILSLMFMFLTGIILFIQKNKNLKWVILLGILLFIFSCISILGPGNKIRGGGDLLQAHHVNLFKVGLSSMVTGFNLVINTLQNPLLIISLLLFIPLAVQLNKNNVVVRTVLNFHPILAVIALVAIPSAAFLPAVWSSQNPPRVANLIYLYVLLNLFLLVQLIVNRIITKGIKLTIDGNVILILKVLLIICMIPSLTNKNTGRAFSDLISKAPAYSAALNSRYELIKEGKQNGQRVMVIPPLFEDPKKYPLSIFYNYQELEAYNNAQTNRIYARYWGLDSIRVSSSNVTDFINKTRVN